MINNDVYYGEWANGKMNGKGRYEYANGDYFEGYF